jgi:XTP/dITP diphosphohydrolase
MNIRATDAVRLRLTASWAKASFRRSSLDFRLRLSSHISRSMRLVLASSNRGKLAEIRGILADLDVDLVAQGDLGIADADETATTFVENALLKARHAAAASGLPALGDDSGICVDALDGAPGLYSARYAGVHGDAAANIARLLDALRDVPDERRGAHFHCVLVLLRHAADPAPLIAEARWHGRILHAPRGSGGFGYDPVFFDPALGRGAAELDASVKNRVSHRGQALAKLREMLAEAALR